MKFFGKIASLFAVCILLASSAQVFTMDNVYEFDTLDLDDSGIKAPPPSPRKGAQSNQKGIDLDELAERLEKQQYQAGIVAPPPSRDDGTLVNQGGIDLDELEARLLEKQQHQAGIIAPPSSPVIMVADKDSLKELARRAEEAQENDSDEKKAAAEAIVLSWYPSPADIRDKAAIGKNREAIRAAIETVSGDIEAAEDVNSETLTGLLKARRLALLFLLERLELFQNQELGSELEELATEDMNDDKWDDPVYSDDEVAFIEAGEDGLLTSSLATTPEKESLRSEIVINEQKHPGLTEFMRSLNESPQKLQSSPSGTTTMKDISDELARLRKEFDAISAGSSDDSGGE